MSSTTAIIIHWYGPYYAVDDLTWGHGLYMLTGRCRHERQDQIQYMGITTRSYKARFRSPYHKIWRINRNLQIWLGEVVYPADANKYYLDMAESMLIHFWWPPLNEKKLYKFPEPTTLISHWFTPDGRPRVNQKAIYKKLYDVLCWDGEQWRVANLHSP